ncbi:TPA_asm: hypothetical protein GND11_004717, partial [Salmonella enterica subsp. salamae serovar 42:f,g,t:--]|nr:hypothetical protein [Salmonella enterica subsp. salamae serovar 42:f,g,t:--]
VMVRQAALRAYPALVLFRQPAVFIVMINVIDILADAVIREAFRQHRVFVPRRCPVARRVGERPLLQVTAGRCNARAE